MRKSLEKLLYVIPMIFYEFEKLGTFLTNLWELTLFLGILYIFYRSVKFLAF